MSVLFLKLHRTPPNSRKKKKNCGENGKTLNKIWDG